MDGKIPSEHGKYRRNVNGENTAGHSTQVDTIAKSQGHSALKPSLRSSGSSKGAGSKPPAANGRPFLDTINQSRKATDTFRLGRQVGRAPSGRRS